MSTLKQGLLPAVLLSLSCAQAAAAAPAPAAPRAAPAVMRSLFPERPSEPKQLRAFENDLRKQNGLQMRPEGGCSTLTISSDGTLWDCANDDDF